MKGAQGMFELLVVGVDGSRRLTASTHVGGASRYGDRARVLAVHVSTYSRELLRDVTPDTMRTWRLELEDDLRTRWVQPLIAADVEHATLLIEDDSPAAGLLGAASHGPMW